jgi:hypothetical protein
MKRSIFMLVMFGLACHAFPQGQMVLHNADNTSTNPTATANGLFWLSTGGVPVPINQDFNAAFYAGTGSSSLSPLATFLLSDGTAAGDIYRPGTFLDLSGKIYTFPSSTSIFMQIQAWTGNFSSYAAAVTGAAPAAQSPIFINPVSVPPGMPTSLTEMPAIVMAVPEPSTFALLGLAGMLFLVFRRDKRNNR